MITKTFILTTDRVDEVGDIIISEGIKINNDHPPKILLEFVPHNVIGIFKGIRCAGGRSVATVDFYENHNISGMYPAIGYKEIKSHIVDGVKYIDECEIFAIGLSRTPNMNLAIRPFQQPKP